MNAQEALRYLFSLESRGIRLDLDPVTRLFRVLGNPQESYRTVHVAGTNGKGSVAAMLSSILMQAGLRVGLYTSPHLVDFRERIRVDGAMIPEDELALLVDRLRRCVTGETTFFEFTTALAFLYFQQVSVDIAVVEVGMGGRLDATNCIDPDVSIITNISLEHEMYLGRCLASIAEEKGGIIKDRGICVSGAAQAGVCKVLGRIARERRARLLVKGKDFSVRRFGNGTCSYFGINQKIRHLRVPLVGRHQCDNAALALAAAEVLAEKGTAIDDRAMIRGIAETRWEGRFERIRENPLVIVDGAHNPAGIRALFRTVAEEMEGPPPVVLFGVMSDKRYKDMLRVIDPRSERVIVTFPRVERSKRLSVEDIRTARLREDLFEIIPDPRAAYGRALELAGERNRMLLVTGSLYLVGEIKDMGELV